MNDDTTKMARDPHQLKLMEAAPALGIRVEDLSEAWNLDAVRFHLGDESRLVFEGRVYPSLTVAADTICNDKHVTKAYFDAVGVPSPKSQVFQVEAEGVDRVLLAEQLGGFFQAGRQYVCKPVYGTEGHAVGMNMRELLDVELHVDTYIADYASWMLEEQVEGDDLRIQVVGGAIVAACMRIPAFVIGDGVHSLEELMALHNEKIAAQNPKNVLEMDAATRQLMREQDVYLSSVIENGRKIRLKLVSNMGQGGQAIDITDQLHPTYGVWAGQLSSSIGIRTFAFDLICTDVSKDPKDHALALELNPRAQWLHHTFSEGKQHDMPSIILRDLFVS